MNSREIMNILKDVGYTQSQIAQALDITQGAISQWLKKDRIPTQHIIALIDLSDSLLSVDNFRDIAETQPNDDKAIDATTLTGAEIVVHCLTDLGVKHLFGYPGGAVLHIYDALYQQKDIHHILVRHEQAATHAADGYARSTGLPGCVLVTSGPGLTNAVTGIATAHMDSIPMIVISGNVPSPLIGYDAFQEVDAVGITRSCVKHNFLVRRVEDVVQTITEAFHIATTGRPGPVHIDIPKDITIAKCNYQVPALPPNIPNYQPTLRGNERQIKKALELMDQSVQPIFYTGGGVILSGASTLLKKLVDITGFPITSTLMGLGAYPAPAKQFLGMLGMHGTYEANLSMHGSDCVIAIGARFDDRITGDLKKFCPQAKIIHIDIDPSSIGKNVKTHIPIVGDIKHVLKQMLQLMDQRTDPSHNRLQPWWEKISAWRAVNSLAYHDSDELIKPQKVIEKVYALTQGNAIVTSDVGQHQMWAAQYYHFNRPRQWINSGGLGTMGFGLPAAMGAKLAFPETEVVCITGEGSIQMMLQELSTILQYRTPVKILNLNNRYLGMVRQWQEFFYDRRYSMSYMEALPDFVKLAESYHHVGIQITHPSELDTKLEQAFSLKDRTVFIDVLTDPDENVYPMISSGGGHNEIMLPHTDQMKSDNGVGLNLV